MEGAEHRIRIRRRVVCRRIEAADVLDLHLHAVAVEVTERAHGLVGVGRFGDIGELRVEERLQIVKAPVVTGASGLDVGGLVDGLRRAGLADLFGGEPDGKLMRAMKETFRTFAIFQETIEAAAIERLIASPFTIVVIGWVSTKSQLPSTST